MNVITVNNTSQYWADFESDTVEYAISWETDAAKSFLEDNERQFLSKYFSLTLKYGIALPNINVDNIDMHSFFEEREVEKIPNWINIGFNRLYHSPFDSFNLFNSSILYTQRQNKIEQERIVNIDRLLSFDEIINSQKGVFAQAIKLDFFIDRIFVSIQNDVFFPYLDNQKTKRLFDSPIDNSALAYLNTPRLNSFLRDLRILCFQFGATCLYYNNIYDSNPQNPIYFNQDGVLIKNEIILYEDIFDLIPIAERYLPFVNSRLELDDMKYRIWSTKS